MENYWILLCRLTVRQTLRNCLSCHRLLQEVLAPLMAGLPKDRLPTASHYPFHTTGLDFIGFSLYDNNNRYLRYIFLFTCLILRSDHSEVPFDFSTDSTIIASEVFLSTRRADKFHIEQRIFFCKCKQSSEELSKQLSSKF